jgi:hypothetical protein
MSINNYIKSIVEAGIKAPSGDNKQPWRCIFEHDKLEFYHVPNKDKSLYNFNDYGSFFAHGAFLENVSIASKHFGFDVNISLFPEPDNENHVATITFSPLLEKNKENDALFDSISQRVSNRKPYNGKSPDEIKINYYKKLVSQYNNCELIVINNKKDIDMLSKAFSLNERMMLENSYIHDVLFETIQWTEEQENLNKIGMYIKTLELNPIQEKMFMMFNKRKILNIFLKLGIGKLIPLSSSSLYRTSGAICAITIPEDSKLNFINAGRSFERLWLNLILDGLSLQPTAGTTYLGKMISHNITNHLNNNEIKLINNNYEIINNIFGVKLRQIALPFRIGKGKNPSAKSKRLQVDQILTIN